jgi:hypothetical protein
VSPIPSMKPFQETYKTAVVPSDPACLLLFGQVVFRYLVFLRGMLSPRAHPSGATPRRTSSVESAGRPSRTLIFTYPRVCINL